MGLSEIAKLVVFQPLLMTDLLHNLQVPPSNPNFTFWRWHFKNIPEQWIDRIHTDEVYMYGARLIVGMLINYFTCIALEIVVLEMILLIKKW